MKNIYIDQEIKKRNCPICNKYTEIDRVKKKIHKVGIIKIHYTVSSSYCNKCKIRYQNPALNQEQMDEAYKHTLVGGEEKQKERYDETLKTRQYSSLWFLKHLKETNGKKLAEIGSSSGYNLAHINKGANFSRVVGFDLDVNAVEYGKKMGHELYSSDFFRYDEKWDYVFMSHLIEHIQDPKSFILGIEQRMNKGGKIIINLPDAQTWLEDPYYEHVNSFSVDAMIKLIEELGFVVEHIESSVIDKEINIVPEIKVIFSRGGKENKKFNIEYTKEQYREWARMAYDKSTSKAEKKIAKEVFIKNKEGRTIGELLLWSKLYRFFTFKLFNKTVRI